jgi:hypothetical protein
MGSYDNYRNTDYLDDISFIGGTELTLRFPVYDEDGVPILINGSSMEWRLGIYGQPDGGYVLKKSASGYDASTFKVSLVEADTLTLGSDVYLQQAIITDTAGKLLRPAQGIVIIRKAIPDSAIT